MDCPGCTHGLVNGSMDVSGDWLCCCNVVNQAAVFPRSICCLPVCPSLLVLVSRATGAWRHACLIGDRCLVRAAARGQAPCTHCLEPSPLQVCSLFFMPCYVHVSTSPLLSRGEFIIFIFLPSRPVPSSLVHHRLASQEIMIMERSRERRKGLVKERAKGQAVIQYLTKLQREERGRANLLRAKSLILAVRYIHKSSVLSLTGLLAPSCPRFCDVPPCAVLRCAVLCCAA